MIFGLNHTRKGGRQRLHRPFRRAQAPLPTIATLDVPRYMGRWYEIAKFPNWFQRKCVADTSANYQLLADGSVEVLNQCRQKNGEMQQALGAARQIGPATSPKLQVRFAPAQLSVLPFVWVNDWVIDLESLGWAGKRSINW